MILKIVKHPSDILRQKAQEIDREKIKSPEFQNFLKDMGKTMLRKDGIGLAGPQVNESIRVITININGEAVAFINPKIIKKSWRKNTAEEGCLSIPGVYGKVNRHTNVEVDFLDKNANPQKIKGSKLLARVFQHEIDHLNGVLFIDKTEK